MKRVLAHLGLIVACPFSSVTTESWVTSSREKSTVTPGRASLLMALRVVMVIVTSSGPE